MAATQLYNVKLPPKTVARLRAFCTRTGLSQGLLLQRFLDQLPSNREPGKRKVTVDITAPKLDEQPKRRGRPPGSTKTKTKSKVKVVSKKRGPYKKRTPVVAQDPTQPAPAQVPFVLDEAPGTINSPPALLSPEDLALIGSAADAPAAPDGDDAVFIDPTDPVEAEEENDADIEGTGDENTDQPPAGERSDQAGGDTLDTAKAPLAAA